MEVPVPHYWAADQIQRLLDALAAHNRHEARTAALIMWRTGLRVSEALELEWRDLEYSGEPATSCGKAGGVRPPWVAGYTKVVEAGADGKWL